VETVCLNILVLIQNQLAYQTLANRQTDRLQQVTACCWVIRPLGAAAMCHVPPLFFETTLIFLPWRGSHGFGIKRNYDINTVNEMKRKPDMQIGS